MESFELFQSLMDVAREERHTDIALLPGAGIHREVLRLADTNLSALLGFFKSLPAVDRNIFIKAIAVYEDSVGGLGSVTTLQRLLPLVEDEQDELLDWILRNTNSYSYYAHGARSLKEFHTACSRQASRKLEIARHENDRQAESKLRIASEATQKLYNAVRRGDLTAVSALLEKGANPSTLAPDGTSLQSLALENNRDDIAAALQARNDDSPTPS